MILNHFILMILNLRLYPCLGIDLSRQDLWLSRVISEFNPTETPFILEDIVCVPGRSRGW
jgi:hypothetical protein